MKKKLLQFRIDFLLLSILLNTFIAYILKYRSVSDQAVTLGYPLQWFTIYNVFKGSSLIQSTNFDILQFAVNTLIYYLIVNVIYIAKVKLFKEV